MVSYKRHNSIHLKEDLTLLILVDTEHGHHVKGVLYFGKKFSEAKQETECFAFKSEKCLCLCGHKITVKN